MIGLNIRVKNATDNFLYKIFNGIDLSGYIWEIAEDDIMCIKNGEHTQGLFNSNIMNGEEFLSCISIDDYYMIFADIKAYPVGYNYSEIDSYEDYLISDCQIILLCADSTFIDFYSKDMTILEKVYENCINYGLEEVTTFTEENDSRTRMSIL